MLIKLTDQKGRTRAGENNETQWGPGVTHSPAGDPNQDLCSDGWIHCYEGLAVALLMNSVGPNISHPIAWECKGKIGKRDGWQKAGCRSLTTVREVQFWEPPLDALVTAAIYCALAVYNDPQFVQWAESWLSGECRSAAEAAEAAAEAQAAAQAEAWAAWAAQAAAEAAEAAAEAQAEAWAAWAAQAAAEAQAAARAAAQAAEAAAQAAAEAAAWAAWAARAAAGEILQTIESALIWWTNPPVAAGTR